MVLMRSPLAPSLERVQEGSVDYGDSYHTVGNQKGPGEETGARGLGKALYFFDPNKHLIEIRHYEG